MYLFSLPFYIMFFFTETAMDHLDIIRINDKECKLILKKPLETISTFEVSNKSFHITK